MNALEIADSIDAYLDSILEEAIHPIEEVLNESTTVLRQLQAENEALKQQVKHLESQVYGGTTK